MQSHGEMVCYVKPTNFCNIGCSHCYLPEFVRADKTLMSMETLEKIVGMITEYAEAYGFQKANILWHGGEPLLVSPDWYWSATEVIRRSDFRFTQSMQTSLTPYRKEFSPLIKKEMNGFIGTSFDLHARAINGSPEKYADLFLKKLEIVREDGIDVGVIMTATKDEIGHLRQILDWFVKNGFRSVRIERFNNYGRSYESWTTNRDHSIYMIELLNAVLDLYEEGIVFYEAGIMSAITGVLEGKPGDRWGTSCTTDYMVFEPDGQVTNCIHRTGKEDYFGTAWKPLNMMLENDHRQKIIANHMSGSNMTDFCLSCEYVSWCKSGCPIQKNEVPSEKADCSGHKMFLDYISFLLDSERGTTLLMYQKDAEGHAPKRFAETTS